MATKLCPDCAEQVRADATTCRHCGHDFTAVAPDGAPTPPWPIALFVLGLLVAVAGLVVVSQGLTMVGLGVGALGGYIWRYKVRRSRSQR
jgi:hypothetical protein